MDEIITNKSEEQVESTDNKIVDGNADEVKEETAESIYEKNDKLLDDAIKERLREKFINKINSYLNILYGEKTKDIRHVKMFELFKDNYYYMYVKSFYNAEKADFMFECIAIGNEKQPGYDCVVNRLTKKLLHVSVAEKLDEFVPIKISIKK